MTRDASPQTPPRRRRVYRQSPGDRWWLSVLLLPAALTAGAVALQGHHIESDLQHDSVAALRAHGLAGSRVEMSGRDATVLVPTGESEKAAQAVVAAVHGISSVDVRHVARTEAERVACSDLQQKVDAAYHGQGMPFAGATAELTSAGKAALQRVAAVAVKCPSVSYVAEGHTDSKIIKGADLSVRRAAVIKKALVSAGIPAGRVSTRGYGDTFPVASNETAKGRALNDRGTVAVVEEN